MLSQRMVRGADAWANVDTRHLEGDPETKEKAVRLKEKIVRSQEGRTFVNHEIRRGSPVVDQGLINTGSHLDAFCTKVLEELDDGLFHLVALETRGDSDKWEEGRRRIDGDKFYKNEESSGIISIIIRVRPLLRKPEHGPDSFAFIHIGRILMEEHGGRPVLPTKLAAILTHEKALFFGENIARHIMRLENCFFHKLNGLKYLSLSDLVRRWKRCKRDQKITFFVDSSHSNGVLQNFHEVFKEETYFKNAFESVADWDSCTVVRETQLHYAMTSVWATIAIFDQIGADFRSENIQVACMFTLFPRLGFHERRDEVLAKFRERPTLHISPWWGSDEWPCGKSTKHPSCGFGFGDPDEIRRLQRALWEEEYGSLPADRQKLKRRRLDSDVSDAEQVDEHRDDNNERRKTEAIKHAKYQAHGIHSEMDDAAIRSYLKPWDYDEVWLLVGLAKTVKHRGALKRMMEYFGGRWPYDRKTRFVEALLADDYYAHKRQIGLVGTLNALGHHSPHPRLFLTFKNEEGPASDYYASLTKTTRFSIMEFLCRYLNVGMEERVIQLESAPFFRSDAFNAYLSEDNEIISLIEACCRAADDSPTASFFRKTRENFVEILIDHAVNARVTLENATKQALAYAGHDWYDRNDMVVACVKWPALAEGIKRAAGLWASTGQFYRPDPNLKIQPECRAVLHQSQTVTGVAVVDDERRLEEAKREVLGDYSHVYIIPNKNPRKFTDVPSAIVFKTPESRVFVIFPQALDENFVKKVIQFLADASVATRRVKQARQVFRKYGYRPHFRDITAAMLRETGQRTNEAIANFVWGHRFCPISKEDWVTPPLDKEQARHVAYYMDMIDAAIKKIGVDNIPDA